MASKRSNIIRYSTVYTVVLGLFLLVVIRVVGFMTADYDSLIVNVPRDSVIRPLPAERGNIYSADGQLLAASIPYYHLMMDMRVQYLHQQNKMKVTRFYEYLDSISNSLSEYFGDRTPAEYRQQLEQAYKRNSSSFLLQKNAVNHLQLEEILHMPLFNKGQIQSGLIPRRVNKRIHPKGDMAQRVIGETYGDQQRGGMYGLELFYDSLLRGQDGLQMRKYAARQTVYIPIEPAQDGADIYTTIDTRMQDIAERTLRNKMLTDGGDWGCVILMEVKTGEIKALANLKRKNDSTYVQGENYAARSVEPGSTFKPIALMAALNDKEVSMRDSVDTGNGTFRYSRRDTISDKVKIGKNSLFNVIAGSSNVGMAKTITSRYEYKPEQFVASLRRLGVMDTIEIDIPGMGRPYMRTPHKATETRRDPDLSSMSYGYAVKLPPLNSIMFYNAIANNGMMMRPMLCRYIVNHGDTVRKFTPTVINPQICTPEVLADMREALHRVVWGDEQETGRKICTAKYAQSRHVDIAGKTGTALYFNERVGKYTGGDRVSFVGFFPYDNPQYTCMCVVERPRTSRGGGIYGGTVVRQIAEQVMAVIGHRSVEKSDSAYTAPRIKPGQGAATRQAASLIGLQIDDEGNEWVHIVRDSSGLAARELKTNSSAYIPDLTGMGAKDAIYLIERFGMQARVSGYGRVVEQSLPAGTRARPGQTISIRLQ
ncbi:MAG: transpeptidase family protein [Paludibacteraceae bacterium]|nr:transpeptidase family protein [Paludibacteraceae bacterium]